MSAFKTKVEISPVYEADDLWMIDAALVYRSDLLKADVMIPTGFIFDGSSIPRWMKAIPVVSYFVKDKIAYPGSAALHDFGYRYAVWPRATTDALYREALLVERAHPLRARLRFWGVRLGGWKSWNEHRKEQRVGDETV